MHKTKRQQKILSLIRARRIGTQQELSAMLERAGFVATQSSISRDLEEPPVEAEGAVEAREPRVGLPHEPPAPKFFRVTHPSSSRRILHKKPRQRLALMHLCC